MGLEKCSLAPLGGRVGPAGPMGAYSRKSVWTPIGGSPIILARRGRERKEQREEPCCTQENAAERQVTGECSLAAVKVAPVAYPAKQSPADMR